MTARNYSSTASEKALTANVSNVATQITLDNVTNLPTPPYTLVLNPDTAIEEIVTVDADQSGVSAPTLKVTRAQDGTSAQNHTSGNAVKHMITARDLQEPQDHIAATAAHGATGAVVGTTNTQTLTNKTLTSPKINENVAVTATATEINILDGVTASTAEINILDGVTASTAELNYVDGVTSAIQTQIDSLFPKGMISPYAGSTAPTGWLLCNGSAVSRTTYSALYSAIGTTYGSGDGSSTFNLPDLLGRTPIGAGSGTGLTERTLGTELGVESVTLTSAQSGMPTHGHGNTFSVTGDGAHTHGVNTAIDISGALSNGDGSRWFADVKNRDLSYMTSDSATHSHGIGGAVSDASGTNAAEAHTNMQPSTVVNFIIKY